MIMVQGLMQELGLDIKFSQYAIRGESPEPFEGCYTSLKDFKDVIDTDLIDKNISYEILFVN